MPICISGCASICLDIHLFCRSACSLVWLSDNPSGNLVVRLHIRQSIWLDICLSAHPFASVCICICLRLYIWQSVLLLLHLSANLSICCMHIWSSACLNAYLLLPECLHCCSSIWLSFCLPARVSVLLAAYL